LRNSTVAGPGARSRGARLVLHLEVLREQPEHAVHVGERLLDLAVHHAEEVERDVELDEQRVDQHQVAEREAPGRDALRGEEHEPGHGDRNHEALADVEQAKRRLALGGR
jgi:hypothetical protein